MFPYLICLNKKFTIIVFLTSLFHNYCFANAVIPNKTVLLPPASLPAHECGSIDIRNECSSLLQLNDCTVIKGFLIIVLLPKDAREPCNYEQYQFPMLREITEFLLFFDVKGLKTTADLFPNLAVIRGRRLFLNYALGFTNMPDLEKIEFKSLVAIQRGHVFVGSCPKLCHLEKINWDRMTLATGENHIYPVTEGTCSQKSACKGCTTEYCWSNMVCQKFENDNVVNSLQGAHHCDEECLGGCYNSTCVVCKGLRDHNACIKKCPEDKYVLEDHQRCYTEEECVEQMGLYKYGISCVFNCPSGFISDNTSNCVPCINSSDCIKICQPQQSNENEDEAITVYNLADADRIKGCQILNGSLVITIRNKVNELDLMNSLSTIREIRGHLKIYRSPHITSIKFLRNLQKISGKPLENEMYSLIVYDNTNLKELWTPEHFELEHGSMYIHLNSKLCNRFLGEFQKKVIHDKSADSLQTSDQEILCGPLKLLLSVEVMSLHTLKLSWRKDRTSDQIEIIHRPIKHGMIFLETSELDSDVCTRITWQRKLVFKSDLLDNGTHYFYTIKNLEQNRRYACLVKTFGTNDKYDTRSELEFATTKMDIPTPPTIRIIKKTDTSLTFKLEIYTRLNQGINYYILELYEHPDDIKLLDKRNYCDQPILLYQDLPKETYATSNHNEDYDDCCARLEESAEDRIFKDNLREKFSCSLDRQENCFAPSDSTKNIYVKRLKLEINETTYALQHLKRFSLYDLQIKACNSIGCSSFSIHSERTNFSTTGDRLDDLSACRVAGSMENRVYFSEPKFPNGLIVAYVIHYRVYLPDIEIYQSHINCVTRMQHAQSRYIYIAHLNTSFNQVAVRVYSLAGDVFISWINVSSCHGPTTKLAGIGVDDSKNGQGLNIFLIFFFIGAGGTLIWICYKRRYWRKLPELRRYMPLHWRGLVVTPDYIVEDRQILVDGFETVRFQNNSDDDQKYLE